MIGRSPPSPTVSEHQIRLQHSAPSAQSRETLPASRLSRIRLHWPLQECIKDRCLPGSTAVTWIFWGPSTFTTSTVGTRLLTVSLRRSALARRTIMLRSRPSRSIVRTNASTTSCSAAGSSYAALCPSPSTGPAVISTVLSRSCSALRSIEGDRHFRPSRSTAPAARRTGEGSGSRSRSGSRRI